MRKLSTALVTLLTLALALPASGAANVPAASDPLAAIAAAHPASPTDVIVRMAPGTRLPAGRVVQRLPLIGAEVLRIEARTALSLRHRPGVISVTPNAAVRGVGKLDSLRDSRRPDTVFDESLHAVQAWHVGAAGQGVAAAVIDTGIAGDLPDFRGPAGTSRVIATAVVNHDATTAGDVYGHGTFVAGLVAGDTKKYAGSAPLANLVSVKVSDDHGAVTLADVIAGLQFVVDHRDTYHIGVVNLSLSSTISDSYRTDPLDAAVEAVWQDGIVVVAAAGNRGNAPDATSYAPANDPYVITVGAVDDQGTARINDDVLAPWSSTGPTSDGILKPEVLAPGAHIVSTLAPGSDFASMCPACIVNGRYIQAGGTSFAAALASGAVADILSAHPHWTPDQVKGALVATARDSSGGAEIDVAAAIHAPHPSANEGLTPNELLLPANGPAALDRISWSRISWSRISWSSAGALAPTWASDSWTCDCSKPPSDGSSVVPSRISWSRISWSRISWSRISWSRISWLANFAL
jgi:serine protease AprX